jgi:hypothetical protein
VESVASVTRKGQRTEGHVFDLVVECMYSWPGNVEGELLRGKGGFENHV